MRWILKALVVVLPIALIVGGLRLCERAGGDRWLSRVREVDPRAQLALDRADVICIAPDAAEGQRAGEFAAEFRQALEENYGDLLGTGAGQRMVVVMFSEPDMVSAYAGRDILREQGQSMAGYTDPSQNAVYVPYEADLQILRHELVHLVMGTASEGTVRYSPWVMEGLAQYFERYDPPNMRAFPPEARAFTRMASGSGVDLKRLLRLQDYPLFVGEQGARNYLEAEALASFLMETRREQFRKYIDMERTRPSGRYELFVSIVGDPDGQLGTDFRRYLQ